MGLKKQIIQFKDEEQVAVYNSAREAASALGISEDRIYKHLSKQTKKDINGFTFKYSGEFTNRVLNNGDFKCPYCDKCFDTYNGLAKHIFRYKEHGDGITQEQLLTDFKYNGVRPTCKCGCGEFTEIRYDGGVHFSDYVLGHHNRVHNNWGHNPKAIEHSAETRRKQYESGERVQWNKGKSWKETFTEDKIKELMRIYSNKDRNNRIRKALKGVPKSEEHIKKLKIVFNTEKYRNGKSDEMRLRLLSGQFSISSEIEKQFIKECVEPLGIEFDTQYYIKDIHHYCDVYVPSKNTIIEFQGDYWHANPKKYLKEELSQYQLEKVKKDEILREYCKDKNIKLIEVWESDFNRDSTAISEMLTSILK